MEKNNYLILFVFMLLLIQPTYAEVVTINSTLSVDWIGNDEFYLRTEDQDFLVNSSNQVDSRYNLSFDRMIATSLNETNFGMFISEFQNINQSLNSVNDSIKDAVMSFNFSQKYAEEVDAHNRVTINYELCKGNLNKSKADYNKELQDKELCVAEKTVLISNNQRLQSQLTNTTNTNKNNETKANNNLIMGLAIGAGGVGLLWMLNNKNKNKTGAIKERREMSFG